MMAGETNNRILVTGGAGFIGSNFIPYFLEADPASVIVNLDKLTYAGNLDNLKEIEKHHNYHFIEGDICDAALVKSVFEEFDINAVIHFAAESHVDNSIESPDSFIKTNIEGTFVLLEAAKKHWLKAANLPKEGFEQARFHHISTDEVYGSLGKDGFFSERSPYAPNSPYSASKAASDFLVRSYFHTYGLTVVTTQCSNNYGPKQHDEKLIPTIIRKAINGEPIPIYGDGSNVRDWLFVLDHCKAIGAVFKEGKPGETYTIGGSNEQSNLHIARKICGLLDDAYPKQSSSYGNQISFVNDRLGHDHRYAIDSSKIQRELAWKPEEDFNSGIAKTIAWYVNKYQTV